jgi:hypothetical protein
MAGNTPTTPRAHDVQSLQNTIDDLSETVKDFAGQVGALSTAMTVHNAKQDPLELLVKKHEIQLNGDPERNIGGIAPAVEKATHFINNFERAWWVIVGVLLTALTVGAVEIFKAGLIK